MDCGGRVGENRSPSATTATQSTGQTGCSIKSSWIPLAGNPGGVCPRVLPTRRGPNDTFGRRCWHPPLQSRAQRPRSKKGGGNPGRPGLATASPCILVTLGENRGRCEVSSQRSGPLPWVDFKIQRPGRLENAALTWSSLRCVHPGAPDISPNHYTRSNRSLTDECADSASS